MTTFILHGGEASHPTPSNLTFFQTILNSTPTNTPHILCVYFARPHYRWADSFQQDIGLFEQANQVCKKAPYYQLASSNLTKFPQQLDNANVIFINGGTAGNLRQTLLDTPQLKQKLDNKLVIGISAGANILSTHYWATAYDEIRQGTGLLPYKLYTHYQNQYHNLDRLAEYPENLPIMTIAEQQFTIFDH